MGIYGALSSAVTGLRAQAHALENISGNIANSQTTGYKRIETDFLDLIPDAPISRQVPGAVLAQSRGTNDIGGDIKTVSNETFIALNSNGFFVVEPKVGQSDGKPVFSGSNFYTRRGDFEIDKDGMLVNGAGYYLKGLPIDTTTGNISGSVPEVIKLSNAFLPAQRTGRIDYQANLPQVPKTTAYNALVPGSELLSTGSYLGTAAGMVGKTIPSQPALTLGGNMAAATVATDDATVNGFVAGQTLTFTVGTATRTFQFHNNGVPAVTGTNIGIDIQAGVKTDTVLGQIQTQLRAAAGPFTTAEITVDPVANKLSISLGTNTTDTLALSGTPALGLGLSEGPHKPLTPGQRDASTQGFLPGDTIVFTPDTVPANPVTIFFHNNNPGSVPAGNLGVNVLAGTKVSDVMAAVQAQLRSSGNSAFAMATTTVNAAGRIEVNMGTNKTNSLAITGAGAIALDIDGTSTAVPPPARLTTIAAKNDALFKSNSVQGGAITVYASNGAPTNVIMRWAKVDSAATGGKDTWNLFYASETRAEGEDVMWTNVGQEYTFKGDGTLLNDVPSVTIENLTVNGVNVGEVQLNHGKAGITQFNDVNGTVSTSTMMQNGYGAGEFVSVAINDDGRVTATYSNGERIDMAQVVTAEFNAINKLKRLDGGVFSATSESGEAILDLSGSGVMGGALEASNTDISDEFTKLIVTQQAYAAGTRIVSAADKMLQEALNMIR
ncbi:MAG: flagellar hook-basal body complex protein [Devosia sp.]|nr:flagellar hook-basal body complex protein [Devosia sp.]